MLTLACNDVKEIVLYCILIEHVNLSRPFSSKMPIRVQSFITRFYLLLELCTASFAFLFTWSTTMKFRRSHFPAEKFAFQLSPQAQPSQLCPPQVQVLSNSYLISVQNIFNLLIARTQNNQFRLSTLIRGIICEKYVTFWTSEVHVVLSRHKENTFLHFLQADMR